MDWRAPAKINVTLRVLGKREDGFHEIETLIVPLGLADRLTVEEAEGWSFSCDDPTVPGDEGNLVVRAARLFFAETSVKPSVRVHLMKSIPHGAGLGGGSSDAAATLRMLDQFYAAGLGTDRLMRMAAELGSDVPVFIDGGAAWCRGRGEIVEAADFTERLPVLLLKPELRRANAMGLQALEGLAPDSRGCGTSGRSFRGGAWRMTWSGPYSKSTWSWRQ